MKLSPALKILLKSLRAKLENKNAVPFQGPDEVLEKIPTDEQLRDLGNLPTEEELKKRGFEPKTFFHGSPVADIKEFVGKGSGRGSYGEFLENRRGPPTTFFSESDAYVENFAKQGGEEVFDASINMMVNRPTSQSRIYPVKLRLDDIYDYKDPDHREMLENQLGTTMAEGGEMGRNLMIGDPFVLQQPEIAQAIKDLGFRGYLTNETSRFGQRTVGLFYPEKGDVRSVFAQFDPKKSDEGNIYASIIPPVTTALGFGALAGLEEGT